MAINRLRQPEDVLLSKWGFKKPVRPVLNKLHPLSFGLEALYLLGDATNGIVYDLSESGNDGVIVNGPLTKNIPSHHGGSASYFTISGAPNKYIDCGSSNTLKGPGGFLSICCWVNYDGTGAFPRIICNTTANDGYTLLAYNFSNLPNFFIRKSGSAIGATDSVLLPRDKWNFLVGTYDNATLVFYVNGVAVGSSSGANGLGLSSNNLLLASDPSVQPSPANNYQGGLEGVRIYNRALTAAEVLQLYVEPYAGIYDAIADRKVVGGAPAPPANVQRSYAEIWG